MVHSFQDGGSQFLPSRAPALTSTALGVVCRSPRHGFMTALFEVKSLNKPLPFFDSHGGETILQRIEQRRVAVGRGSRRELPEHPLEATARFAASPPGLCVNVSTRQFARHGRQPVPKLAFIPKPSH